MKMTSVTTLQCPLCSQPNFVSIESLRSSLINVTNRPLICPICNEIQLGLDKLTIHLLSHTAIKSAAFIENCTIAAMHTNTAAVPSSSIEDSCIISIDRAAASQLKTTSTVSTNTFACEVPDCQFCGCTFRTIDLRRMHMQLVHELFIDNKLAQGSANDSAHFQCSQCSKRFKMEGSLHLHCRMVHGKLSAGVRRMEKRFHIAQKPTTKLNAVNNVFVNDDLSHRKFEVEEIGSSSSSGATAVVDEKTFDCSTCSKSFTSKYFLKKHKRLHTGEMPYVCEICNRTFTFQQSYHRHLSYHTDDRPHICTVCGRAFKELSTLHNHERIHSGEKPFKCETCEKCFRQRISYLVHRRIHTGVLPYECATCDKKFRYKISLRTHKCSGLVGIPEIQPSLPPPLTSNDIETLPAIEDLLNLDCSRALDEFVTESYNRMGIFDSNEPSVGIISAPEQLTANNNYFHYAIDAEPNVSNQAHEHQPFEHEASNVTPLPTIQELLPPSTHPETSIDTIHELFLGHHQY